MNTNQIYNFLLWASNWIILHKEIGKNFFEKDASAPEMRSKELNLISSSILEARRNFNWVAGGDYDFAKCVDSVFNVIIWKFI